MADILLVEDNIELATLIETFLTKQGYCFHHQKSGEEAQSYLQQNTVDLILLDIMLPGIDGFAFCQYVRHQSNVPILIISARSTKSDQLMGFELGADDYLEKPIDIDILCAKIKVLLNRQELKNKQTIIHSGALKIDKDARKVYLKERLLDLNTKEYALLLLFIENAGKTLHKEYLFNEIWGIMSESESQTLTVHIKMLRSKIEEDPRLAKRIQTVWGVGYRYEEI